MIDGLVLMNANAKAKGSETYECHSYRIVVILSSMCWGIYHWCAAYFKQDKVKNEK